MDNAIQILFDLPAQKHNIRAALAARINFLIENDFDKLIYILYRFDINEAKLKNKLASSSSDAGELIADMVIERDEEKKLARKKFRQDDLQIPDDEKW
jgi:CRISPR/Cas system-associated protein endoribonuclease Cas2